MPSNIIKDVNITENVFGGDGFAKLDNGQAIFVPFTAPGDVVTVEITEEKKSFCRGMLRKVQVPSPCREKALCPFFERCGGCAYQHINYESECNAKRNQLQAVVKRIGHLADFPELDSFTPSPVRYGYRNKLKLEPFEYSDGYAFGFCERDNTTFFQVKQCPLAMDAINAAIPAEQQKIKHARFTKFRRPYPVTIRSDAAGSTVSYLGRASEKLVWLKETLLGKEVSVPVGSFWQVNSHTADALFTTLRNWIQPLEMRSLIDAYAGIGTFSLAMGDLFQYRAIIESDAQAVTASKFNHDKYGLKARFIAGTTENALGSCLANVKSHETVVLLDPPRTGCLPKVLKELLSFTPQYIAYVSCNPATLARDLDTLCNSGKYQVVKAAAFDMFPATAHFESAVLLKALV